MSKKLKSLIEGTQVTLLADKAVEVEQTAIYLGISGNECHMVCVDKKYRRNKYDDGLREVDTKLIKELS